MSVMTLMLAIAVPITMQRFAITVFIFEDGFSFATWKNGKRTTIRCCLDGEMWGWVLNGGSDGIVGMGYCAAEIHAPFQFLRVIMCIRVQ